jgi:hypothetical protein
MEIRAMTVRLMETQISTKEMSVKMKMPLMNLQASFQMLLMLKAAQFKPTAKRMRALTGMRWRGEL